MKKILMIIFIIVILLNINVAYASDTEAIIGEQEQALGISGFIKQAQKYTSEVFKDTDINDLYKSALTGEIKAEGLMRSNLQAIRYRSNKNTKKPRIHTNHNSNT